MTSRARAARSAASLAVGEALIESLSEAVAWARGEVELPARKYQPPRNVEVEPIRRPAGATTAKPIKLPTPEEMVRIVFELERRLMADVTRGREELRRFFRDGRIDLGPQPGGFYVARSEILPLVLLTRDSPGENPGSVRYTGSGCAGRI